MQIISRSKAVVTATRLYEGQPTLLCEASKLGIPSVFPDTGGVLEFFPENYPLSYKKFDQADLINKLKLISNKDLHNQLSVLVKENIEVKLSDSVLLEKLNNIFGNDSWKDIVNNPIPVDQDPNHAPDDVNNWQKAVKVLFDQPNQKHYRHGLLTDHIAEKYSGRVACKSYNWLKPQEIEDTDAEREVYIGAEGFVAPCCMMGSAISRHLQNSLHSGKPRSEYEHASQEFMNRILEIGIDKFDTSKHTLEEILNSGVLDELVYNNITQDDTRKGRIPYCTLHCGSHNSYGRPSNDDRDNG